MTTPTKAVLAAGSVLAMAAETPPTPPTTYTDIKETRSIGDTGETGTLTEVTRIDSPNKTREYISGMRDGAEREIIFNSDPSDAGQTALIAAANAGEQKHFQLTLTNGQVGTFILTLLGYRVLDLDPNEAVRGAVTAKQSGSVTWT